jgi:hypothetical protein
LGILGWLVIHRLGVCVPGGIVSGLMGLAMSVRERSVEVPSVDAGAVAKRQRVACSSSLRACGRKDWHMSLRTLRQLAHFIRADLTDYGQGQR